MRSLTFCAICLLAVAAGLAVYEALNAWVGVKARGLMPAWARSDQAGGSSRGRLMRVRLACGRVLWRRLRVSPRFQ